MKKHTRLLLLSVMVLLLLACDPPTWLVPPTATPTPTPSPTPIPTPTPRPTDTGWQPVKPGLDVRTLQVEVGGGTEAVIVVRITPGQCDLHIRYAPGQAQAVSLWAAQTGATLTVNAGYFTEANAVTGLTISEGVVYGTPLGDFAGMLAVTAEGDIEVRWLREQPYDPAEPLRAAVQSFPLLVKPGGVMGFPADADDGRASRRTVVAQDRSGRVLFLVAPKGSFSLHALAVWLVTSDLDVDVALNLDGGPSTGLWLVDGPHAAQVDSLSAVPAVLTVE